MSFYLPAEWSEQSAIQLTWPHSDTDWAPNLNAIEHVYLNLAKHISARQCLVVSFHNEELKLAALSKMRDFGVNEQNLRTFIAPNNDTWARDHGPITLLNEQGENQLLDFRFNAWGAKYEANHDDKITFELIQQPFVSLNGYQNVDMVLEGGSIESDGEGTILTTETCLLNPNRNPQMNKEQIEASLKTLFNAKQVLWLTNGHLAGDDTDAHIDTLARLAPQGIVYVACDDKSDSHYDALAKMQQELSQLKNADGEAYTLFPLPWPNTITNEDGDPLPATYANYLIINDAVLVPVYNDANDSVALEVIAKAHPNREIIAVDCRAVIQQFGSLHCLTMQLPKGLIE